MASDGARKERRFVPSGEDDGEIQAALQREEITWRESLAFVLRLMRRHPVALTFSILFGLGIAASEFLSVSLLLPFLDTIGGPGGSTLGSDTQLAFILPYFDGYTAEEKIRLVAAGFFAIQLVKAVLGYATGRIAHYLRIVMDRDVRTEIFDQLLGVDLAFIHREKVANLYTILHSYPSDVARIAREMLNAIPKLASFLGYLAVLLILSWELTLVALALAVVANASIGVLSRVVRRMGREVNVYRVRLKHVSLEALQAMRVLRLFHREDHMRDRFQRELRDYQGKRYQKSSVDAAVGPIYSTMITGMFALVLVAGTYILSRSATSWVLLLTVFMAVVIRLMGPTTRYARTRNKIAGKLPSIEEIVDFLRRGDKPFMEDGTRPVEGLRHGIRFSSVRFRYRDDEPEALRGIDLAIPRGRTVALVGGSGAGKTTVANLLARLHDPTGGRITVDGVDLRDLQVGTWRRQLAVVSQDTFLFNATVRENIRFGRLDATDAEVEAAARQANAHGFIEEMAEGYGTLVGERGVRLSGGQKQRIAIARALLADPDVLILDEATSALDTATERQVQEALERLSTDRTVLAIAHRLSTVRNADEIVVLEEGEVVERGTHGELLSRRGHYWRYVRMQDLLDDEGAAGTLHATDPPGRVPAGLYLEVGDGSGRGRVRENGHVLQEVPVLTSRNGRDVEGFVDATSGDVAIVRGARATIRLGERRFDDVPVRRTGRS